MRPVFRAACFAIPLAIAGCGGALQDPLYPTGSASLAAHDGRLFAANTDQGTVSVIEVGGAPQSEVEAGLEPTRIARVGETFFVTLRNERAVAVMDLADGVLTLRTRVEVGAEPFGIVAAEKGADVYVALSLQDEVIRMDPTTLAVTARYAVPGQPRGLALHPSGRMLYVGTAMAGFSSIDLRRADVVPVEMPEVIGADPLTFEPVALTGRVTGDPAVSPDGETLAIPALYVNNVSPVSELDPGMEMPDDSGYGGAGATARFNPAVVTIPLSPTGKLRTEYTAVGVPGANDGVDPVRSYPSSAVWAPDNETLLLTMEGSDAVVALDGADLARSGRRGQPRQGPGVAVSDESISIEFASTIPAAASRTASGPRSIAFTAEDAAWVHAGFAASVADVRFRDLEDRIADGFGGFTGIEDFGGDTSRFAVGEATMIADTVLPEQIALGRVLFYAASDATMGTVGAAVSCATCHFDGRNDGLTWQFEIGPRQTPSLAGRVSETAPFTWTDAVETVAEEATLTSQGRMGGHGLLDEEADAIAAFVDWTREADVPLKGADDDAVRRGRAIFERADVGCAECHVGARLTDGEGHDLYGEIGVNTPSLTGVAASAPYLHDGSAPTLRAVLDSARAGGMGDTGSLSEAEMRDLERFLRTL
jgi:DNA-binding beta-propeller fold protein YncE/mono/diheme cytochrome c family protein